MDSVSRVNLSKEHLNNMIQETKDTAANMITVLGTGSVVMGWNEALTLILLVTGIVFNVVRIYEIKRRKKDQ